MEVAIRWSPKATPKDARFLIVDVEAHTVKLCEALGISHNKIKFNEISRNSKVPPFRAFDWSAAHDIIAVGHYSGASVVGLTNDSPSLSLPLKLPRTCNAVAFNIDRLLASGVERVRNDYCLNVYDVSHWPSAAGNPTETRAVEPAHKLAMSEAITSIKFFPTNPSILVAGVKGTCVRLYDLRERTGNPALQYQTSRVHNIAVDFSDDWYFASAGPGKDSTIHVWDRRATVRNKSNVPVAQEGPLLELQNVIQEKRSPEPPSIWSLRFSTEKRGCLGVMGSNGVFKVCHLQKDYIEKSAQSLDTDEKFAVPLRLQRTQLIQHPQQRRAEKSGGPADGKEQIVAFDHMNFFGVTNKLRTVTIGLQQDVYTHEIYTARPRISLGSGQFIATSDRRHKLQEARRSRKIRGIRMGTLTAIDGIFDKQSARRRGSLHYAKAAVRKEAADTWQDWEDQIDQIEDGTAAAMSEELVQPKLNRVFEAHMRERCGQGYSFDANKNSQVTGSDPILNLFWRWIQSAAENAEDEGMVGAGVDFSFLGVRNIVNANLGSEEATRTAGLNTDIPYAINWLAANLGLTGIEVKEGFLTARRRLALHSIGLRSDNLKKRVQQLAMAGQNAEAALRSLILCDNSLVLGSLTNGPRRGDMTFVFDDVHKWLTNDQEIDEERQKMIRIKLNQEEDPFVHAIYYIMLADNRQPLRPFERRSLPFHYRLAMALRYVDDDLLRDYIDDSTRAAVTGGELDKIMLTGLSEEGLGLITRYLTITSDLQTAILAISHVSPRYIRHSRKVTAWRAAYRNRLNAWGMYIQRCAFDVEASKLAIGDGKPLLTLSAAQIALRCGNCDGPFMSDQFRHSPATGSGSMAGPRSFAGGVLGGPGEVTQCPRCGVRLPHCSVCDMPTGVLDPLTRGGEEKEKQSITDGQDPRDDLLELCMTCDHVYHRGCAEQWFVKHGMCPAVGCDCHCDELDEDEHGGDDGGGDGDGDE